MCKTFMEKIIKDPNQGSKTFSSKRPESKYFILAGHLVCHNHLTLPLYPENHHRQHVNKYVWLYSNKSLFTKTDSILLI